MSVYAIHEEDPKFIFIINYKVMFTSLYQMLPEYFPTVNFYYKKQVKKYRFSDFPKYAIVRNPYDRVVSTYYDKCQRAPDNSLEQERSQLQYCQHQLLNAIKEIRGEKHKIAVPAIYYTSAENPSERRVLNENLEFLKTISFDEYVECMTFLLNEKDVDGHFQKQYDVFDIPGQNPFYNPSKVFKKTNIIKLENIDLEWEAICDYLGSEIKLQKSNKTDHLRPSFDKKYTPQSQEAISNIYKIDFIKFDYSMEF